MIKFNRLAAAVLFLALPTLGHAQRFWDTPAGGQQVGGAVAMCLNGTNKAVPCSAAAPLATTAAGGGGGGGDATAANQTSQITQETAINTVLGVKTDAKSTATDGTSISFMQVMKQISASVQAPPSQAVTNAGTFAVQAVGVPTSLGQKTAANSTSVVLSSDGPFATNFGITTDAKSTATDSTAASAMSVWKQISASAQKIAAGSGVSATATFTPAAAAYGAADIMDVAKQLSFTYADGTAVPTGTQIRVLSAVTKIDVTAVPSGQTTYTLQLYSVTPPSAQADNAAWTLASGDLPSYRGSIALGTPADLGAALYIRTQYIDADIGLASGQSSLFGELVTDGAHTSAAVARTVILYGIIP